MTDADCVALLQWALPRLRLRWPGFRKVRRQVCKRIGRRMRELGLEEPSEYRIYLDEHPMEWEVLDGACRVTISRFFRDREVFASLRDTILPTLARAAELSGREELLCWSAGCGSGEEPYTLSLLWRLPSHTSLSSRFPRTTLRVIATDTDPTVLARARSAVYPPGALREVPESWLSLAFDDSGSDRMLKPELREGVHFLELDLRRGAPEEAFDLIFCRNLAFTYFEEPLQMEVLRRLLSHLRHGGCLLTGGHESLPQGEWPLSRPDPGLPLYLMKEAGEPGRSINAPAAPPGRSGPPPGG